MSKPRKKNTIHASKLLQMDAPLPNETIQEWCLRNKKRGVDPDNAFIQHYAVPPSTTVAEAVSSIRRVDEFINVPVRDIYSPMSESRRTELGLPPSDAVDPVLAEKIGLARAIAEEDQRVANDSWAHVRSLEAKLKS